MEIDLNGPSCWVCGAMGKLKAVYGNTPEDMKYLCEDKDDCVARRMLTRRIGT